MVSFKITENIIIKVLFAILGSWRWGPYGGRNYSVHMSITQFRAYYFTNFLLSIIITMLYDLGINRFVSVVFAKADQSHKASDHLLCKLELLLCGMGISLYC